MRLLIRKLRSASSNLRGNQGRQLSCHPQPATINRAPAKSP